MAPLGRFSELLSEEASRSGGGMGKGAVLLVGGEDDDSTQRLWHALQDEHQELPHSAPLLYSSMHIETVDSEEGKRIGLWLLKGPAAMADALLEVPLRRETLAESSVIINVNLAKPAAVSR
jgi:hypothetical protein